jgi:uncharacterized LabA/DUF88 family protein
MVRGDYPEINPHDDENPEMSKLAVFVDVQNIYYTTRDAYGRQFNYREFWRRLEKMGEIAQATAYAIDRGDPGQMKFQAALTHIGFNVKLKPYIQRRDGSAKGDWDVGITIDVLAAAPSVNTIVLLSGDGDFDLLLKETGLRNGVASVVVGVPSLTAKSLIDSAGSFIPIGDDLLL